MKKRYFQPITETAGMEPEQMITTSFVLDENDDLEKIISGGGKYDDESMDLISRMGIFPEF